MRKILSIGLFLLSIGFITLPCYSAPFAGESLEYAVKGAYLFKFGTFVEWPSESSLVATSPLVIGILGEDPFGGGIDEMIKGRQVNGHSVKIHRFHHGEQPKDIHILFVSRSEQDNIKSIAEHLYGVLTVGEFESATPEIMINFVTHDNTVRFEVDLDWVRRAGLKLSSKLLSVAKVIRGKQ